MGIQAWPKIKSQDIPWRQLVLLNGWIIYDPGVWPSPMFCRVDGMVYLKGLIRDGTATSGTPLTYLPVGCRPAKQEHIIVNSANAMGGVGVEANGEIWIKSGVSTWLSLDAVSFVAEDYQWR